MKIIISPAKKMVTDMESLPVESIPVFIDQAARLMEVMRCLSYEEEMQRQNRRGKLLTLSAYGSETKSDTGDSRLRRHPVSVYGAGGHGAERSRLSQGSSSHFVRILRTAAAF